jgi:uncharacterized damage-inducible protein DinB
VIKVLEPILDEFREEAAVTRRVIERVPADKLSWKPHPSSVSLGQLAFHVARIPGSLVKLAQTEEFDPSEVGLGPPVPNNVREIHDAFDQSVQSAEECLSSMTEQVALGNRRLRHHGNEISTRPCICLLRSMVFNPWYHHRGQLSVYFRLLEVPLPIIYGRGADETPFA